jgi:hypothetical protein
VANETFVWGFMNESPSTLETMGWDCSSTSTNTIQPRNTYQYKPAGAPANYSLAFDDGANAQAPAVGRPATAAGSVSTAVRLAVGRAPTSDPILWVSDGTYVRGNVDGTIDLYIDSVLKAVSTAVIDWQDFRWLTLYYDATASPRKAKVEVDNVEVISEQTEAVAARAANTMEARIYGFGHDRDTHHGAFVWRDGYTSAAPKRYVTIVEVDSDVSETGTWTPDSGSDNFARIDGPLDAGYTEEPSPSALDKVVCGLTANLASKLGFTPTTIDAVCTIAVSTGSGQTARAVVGDGSAVTNGDTAAIGASETMTVAVAPTSPSGGAWSGSDAAEASYEIVSV